MNQTSIFDLMYEKYKITKPIRLIEFFAGYGSQALALKYLGVPFEHWKTCEWAIKSIQAYKDIHFPNDNNDYFSQQPFGDDWLISWLYQKGISSNYNEPMSKDSIVRLGQDQRIKIYNNICATNNLVNIQQVKGKDLNIVDTDKYEYILTYSFPCQDLSLAGKGKGMSDTSTRSGMLWEVERILEECHELGTLPQILLMENVPQVHGQDNISDFHKWQLKLESLGYKNYMQDLIATDYGIPQTRNRCFMISLLGDYSYTFPQPIPLKLKLKDMLEDNVDEKYYLSDKQIEDVQNWNAYEKPLENMEKTDKTNISPTLTTRSGAYAAGMILIKNNNSKGYLEAEEGDGIDISSRMEHHRGTVQKGMIQTLDTKGGDGHGVVVNMKTEMCNDLVKDGKVKENDVIRHNYTSSKDGDCIQSNDEVPTLDTRCDCLGVVVNDNNKANKIGSVYDDERSKCQGGSIYSKENSSPTLSTGHSYAVPFVTNQLRIRKLTPYECFALMGVKREDYLKCAKNQSDSSLYHLAGDSIVVNVLESIFKELL